MVRLFNHWFASNTLMQVVFDALLLFLSVVLAVAFLNRGEAATPLEPSCRTRCCSRSRWSRSTPSSASTSAIPAGRSRRRPRASCFRSCWRFPSRGRSSRSCRATEAWDETLRLAVPLAFVTFVAIRGIAAHSGMSPMFARRTLVLGTGAEAAAVEQSIAHLGQAIRFLGFYPGEEDRRRAPGGRRSAFSPSGIDLVDAVRRLQGRRNHRRRARAAWRRAAAARAPRLQADGRAGARPVELLRARGRASCASIRCTRAG